MSGMKERLGRGVERTGISALIKNRSIEVVYIAGIVVMSAGIVSALASPVSQSYIIYPGRDA